ncbi:MAP3K12-binding inhibitory protein 1, partial [Stegodyphus mimosarum]
MESVRNVLSSVEQFLKEIQHIGIIKEFLLVPTDSAECDISTFNKLFDDFALKISTMCSHNSSLRAIEKSEENEIIDVEGDISSDSFSSAKKNLVQIQVDDNEIKRRISAFVSRKRKEVDEWNVQEFCNRPYVEEQSPAWEQIESCARVDAVFIPRFGSKSHVKVSKVENRWGPQTQCRNDSLNKRIKKEPDGEQAQEQSDVTFEAIQERLQNMESHLKLKSDSSMRYNIMQRLKELENRILFLEGISPDYFHVS